MTITIKCLIAVESKSNKEPDDNNIKEKKRNTNRETVKESADDMISKACCN